MRLLVVEDERSLSRAIVAILVKNNYSVDAVYDGIDALSYADSTDYDGIILDLMIPMLDGIGVLKALRSRGNRTPVLILSAKSEVEDKILGLDSGANDYLTKPFAVGELLARIRAMTRRETEQVDARLHLGNITLDCVTCELSSPSGSFPLANKEFQMMEIMMRAPLHRISTERFMEKIWGYNSDAELSVVWVYISYLRKKLRALNADIEICVQRNVGYYLREKVSS